MDALTGRIIKGAGTPESAWLAWLAQTGVGQDPIACLAHDDARLVVVAPHPDDEILACGGLLADRAAKRLESLIVAVTDGEASHGAASAASLARLAARRAEESHAGLMALGITQPRVVRMGVPDGDVGSYELALIHKLEALLKPSDIVVTTWCLDGHPDHEATANATLASARTAGCRVLQAPVWMWHWCEPGNERVPWHCLARFELPPVAWSAKQDALRRHHSQLEPRAHGVGPVLVQSIVERAARPHEYFFV